MKSIKLFLATLPIIFLFWQCSDDDSSKKLGEGCPSCPNCPLIESIQPNEAQVGSEVIVYGKNFDRFGENGTGSITINGLEAIFIELVSTEEIKIEIPADVSTGEVIICALNPNPLKDNVLCSDECISKINFTVLDDDYFIEILGGDKQEGVVGEQLGKAISVRLVDHLGSPIEDIEILFNVIQGGGSVESSSTITNIEGFAETLWTLGNDLGEQIVEVSVNSNNIITGSILITSTGTCPVQIEYEGETYPIVQIGSQCWLQKNLNVGNQVDFITHPDGIGWPNFSQNDSEIEKYAYDDFSPNLSIYGGIYSRDEAMNYSEVEGVTGICPQGYHVPTKAEWEQMINYLGGSLVAGGKLKSTNYWIGPNVGMLNESGFSAYPSGHGSHVALVFAGSSHSFIRQNEATCFITSSSIESTDISGQEYKRPLFTVISHNSEEVIIQPDQTGIGLSATSYCSCRCIKNQN